MTFSALAGDRRLALGTFGQNRLKRYMPRIGGEVTAVTNHGIVGDIPALQRELLKTSRTLSVNYGVGSDGRIYGCVSERLKANTTSHASDHYSATVEIANSPTYPHAMTEAAFDAAARLNADICVRNGFEPNASTINFHREYVATQCPGDHTWARRAEFIALVRTYWSRMKGGATPKPAPAPAPAPKPTAALPAKGVAMLEGVGIGDVVRIRDWMLYDDPSLRTGERKASGDYKIVSITYRYRGGIEPSLQLEDSRGGRAWAHCSAVRGVQRGGAPVKPAPKPASAPARKSNDELAAEVLAGKWGNGGDRQRRIEAAGYSFSAVQAAVNARLGGARPAAKSIAQMAAEVIAGKHGSGHSNRQRSLGINAATYAKVRAEVNRRV